MNIINPYRFVSTDNYNRLLLHMDGTNGSTNFVDELGHSMTAYGNAQISTAQKVFGTGSGLFDGTGDYLKTLLGTDFNFGTGNFTIETRIRPTNLNIDGNAQILFDFCQDANNEISAYFGTSGYNNRLVFRAVSGGVTQALYIEVSTPTILTINTWAHLAFVRIGSTLKIFVNGNEITLSPTTAISTNSMPTFTSGYLAIGAFSDGGGTAYYGYLDEVRISNGIARWTSNFTPPTNPY